jgi:hypothetical protein
MLIHTVLCRVFPAAEEAASLQLRQSGNTAFKEGRLSEALALYYQAASHNPQDHALFNNISLTALRNGDPHQAGVCWGVLCCVVVWCAGVVCCDVMCWSVVCWDVSCYLTAGLKTAQLQQTTLSCVLIAGHACCTRVNKH